MRPKQGLDRCQLNIDSLFLYHKENTMVTQVSEKSPAISNVAGRITVTCPHCHAKIFASANAIRGRCPKCNQTINLVSPPEMRAKPASLGLEAAMAPLAKSAAKSSRNSRRPNRQTVPWLLITITLLIPLAVVIFLAFLLSLPSPSASDKDSQDIASVTQPVPNYSRPTKDSTSPASPVNPAPTNQDSSHQTEQSTLKPSKPSRATNSFPATKSYSHPAKQAASTPKPATNTVTPSSTTLKPFGPLEWNDSLGEVLKKIQAIDGLEEITFSRLYNEFGDKFNHQKFTPEKINQNFLPCICGPLPRTRPNLRAKKTKSPLTAYTIPRSDKQVRVMDDQRFSSLLSSPSLTIYAYPVVIHDGVFRLSVNFFSGRSMAFCEPTRCLDQAKEIYGPDADFYFPLALQKVCLTLVEKTSSPGFSSKDAERIIGQITAELEQKYPDISPQRTPYVDLCRSRGDLSYFPRNDQYKLEIVTWSDNNHQITTGAKLEFPKTARTGITHPDPVVFYENLTPIEWNKKLTAYLGEKRSQKQREKFANTADHKDQL